jgi:hypothetical protein
MVSVADVGRLVADTLWKSCSGQRVIELEGPQRYAPNDVATALTAVLGRSVKAEALPRGHWDQAFRTLGLPVADADVTLAVGGTTQEVKVKSSEHGVFRIGTLPFNTELSLSVTKAGYLPFEKRFHSHENLKSIVITMRKSPSAQ